MGDYLKRKMDSYLLGWKQNKDHMPLIVKGARQVGKTKSIEHFASLNYESVIEINFAEEPIYKRIIENGYSAEAIIKKHYSLEPECKIHSGQNAPFLR